MKSHLLSQTKTYFNWTGMKQRCHNPKDKNYHRYGARGIKVCKRWHKFENFFKDMGHAPEGYSIERINNMRGYSPANCRWATTKEQNRNTRSNRLIKFKGQTRTLMEWSEITGLNYSALSARLNKCNWPVDKALTTPIVAGGNK